MGNGVVTGNFCTAMLFGTCFTTTTIYVSVSAICTPDPYRILCMIQSGIPMALNQTVTAFGIMILQSGINQFGSSVMAAYTAASKLESLVMQPMIALGSGHFYVLRTKHRSQENKTHFCWCTQHDAPFPWCCNSGYGFVWNCLQSHSADIFE